jgi:anti-sigma B factor antagonist
VRGRCHGAQVLRRMPGAAPRELPLPDPAQAITCFVLAGGWGRGCIPAPLRRPPTTIMPQVENPMRVQHPDQPDLAVVTFEEARIDAVNSQALKQQLLGLVGTGSTRLVLDLSRVEFLASCGLGMLVAVLRRCGKAGGVWLCGVRPPVAATLRLTALDRVFRITADTTPALAAFGQGLPGTGHPAQAEITLDSRFEETRRLRSWLTAVLEEAGSLSAADDLELALAELVTNIVQHGYGGQAGHVIDLRLEHQGELVRVEIRDSGRPVPAAALAAADELPAFDAADLDSLPVDGMGLALARAMVDRLEHRQDGAGNLTIVEKRLDHAYWGVRRTEA